MTVDPDFIRKMAQVLTGHHGTEALNRFAKQLVCGACKDRGFWDKSNDSMQEVYERPYVVLGHFNVLTRFSFISETGAYLWDFGSGVSEGQKLSGYASSKGRKSQWVGDGAAKQWSDHNVTGVVLVGMHEKDVEFFFVPKDEFLALDKDRIFYKRGLSAELQRWSKAWDDLIFQPTFGSLMGVK